MVYYGVFFFVVNGVVSSVVSSVVSVSVLRIGDRLCCVVICCVLVWVVSVVCNVVGLFDRCVKFMLCLVVSLVR